MGFLFRKKVAAADVAELLVEDAAGEASVAARARDFPPDLDRARLTDELAYLRVLGTELGIRASLKDAAEAQRLLAMFENRLRVAQIGGTGATFLEAVRARQPHYESAGEQDRDLGSRWQIGKVFAWYCGAPEDATVVALAGKSYQDAYEETGRLLRSSRLVFD